MIKILVLNSDVDGVGYYRTLNPHLCIDDKDIKVDIRLLSDGTLKLNEDLMKDYDILVWNKYIPFVDENYEAQFFKMLKRLNIKTVYDIDDYWKLDNTHINYKNWMKSGNDKKVEAILQRVDVVTTTTEIFANEIRKFNKNVIVIPNAINNKEHQWSLPRIESDRLRFIWGGGIAHKVDLKLIKDDFKKFNKDFLNRSQVIMCGFDLRIKLQNSGVAKDNVNKSQWGRFEDIFSNNMKYIQDQQYTNFLRTSDNFDNDDEYGYKDEYLNNFYQRRHTKPIGWYGSMYREADVGLAPLKNRHSFNRMKSQLKLIEAGAWGIPVIMSKTGPYLLDDIEKNGLGLYVEEGKDHWNEKMQWYLDNPTAVKEHGEANHEYFLKNFEMGVVNQQRINLYNHIVNQNTNEIKL